MNFQDADHYRLWYDRRPASNVSVDAKASPMPSPLFDSLGTIPLFLKDIVEKDDCEHGLNSAGLCA